MVFSLLGNDMKQLKEALSQFETENQKLTSALQSAMEDNAHMSEKLLISEQAQESLKVSPPIEDLELFSVVDPGCLSRIRFFSIPDPNFFHPGSKFFSSRFSDPH
jgi:hypothetical protein